MEQKIINVLNTGFVRLVDYMGNDSAIVQAARVSYGDGTKTVREDKSLINYLIKNEHMSPFEMCELKFQIKLPIDVMRQLVRHRTASINEYSTRYSIAVDDYNYTDKWRLQSKNNKQGSSDEFLEDEFFINEEKEIIKYSKSFYNQLLENNVAREHARKILPLGTYTLIYWKIDLRNILHFLKLRLDSHAQYEIREYAKAIAEFVKELFPITWEAFEEHVLYAKTFSKTEFELLKKAIDINKILFLPDLDKKNVNKLIEKIY